MNLLAAERLDARRIQGCCYHLNEAAVELCPQFYRHPSAYIRVNTLIRDDAGLGIGFREATEHWGFYDDLDADYESRILWLLTMSAAVAKPKRPRKCATSSKARAKSVAHPSRKVPATRNATAENGQSAA